MKNDNGQIYSKIEAAIYYRPGEKHYSKFYSKMRLHHQVISLTLFAEDVIEKALLIKIDK